MTTYRGVINTTFNGHTHDEPNRRITISKGEATRLFGKNLPVRFRLILPAAGYDHWLHRTARSTYYADDNARLALGHPLRGSHLNAIATTDTNFVVMPSQRRSRPSRVRLLTQTEVVGQLTALVKNGLGPQRANRTGRPQYDPAVVETWLERVRALSAEAAEVQRS